MITHTIRRADELDVAIGVRIRVRRQAAGLSQSAVAEALGVSFQQVQKYERGSNRIAASMLIRMARVLQCSPPDLLGDDQSRVDDGEFLALATAPGAIDLLRAYVRIRDYRSRSGVLAVAEGLAGGASDRNQA